MIYERGGCSRSIKGISRVMDCLCMEQSHAVCYTRGTRGDHPNTTDWHTIQQGRLLVGVVIWNRVEGVLDEQAIGLVCRDD